MSNMVGTLLLDRVQSNVCLWWCEIWLCSTCLWCGNLWGVQTLSGECGVYGKSQKERRWKVTKYWMLGWVWWTENAGESLWSVGRV